MSESSNKQMKLFYNLPEELVVRVSSFLPIQSLSQNCLISKRFRHTEIRSLDLDFSGIFSVRRTQLEAVNIIQNVFNKHEGSTIKRFVLCLKEIGGEESITSWINTCISKNIQELVLDFSRTREVMEISIDFSAIDTLTVLALKWCKFEIPDNSPKGLKLLRTLSLMCTEVKKDMIDAIFQNCIHLESLELIKCGGMYGVWRIHAHNHKKFKSLVVSSMPNLMDIVAYAPTLEYFKYDGYVINVFLGTDALKEASLHYNKNRRTYDSGHHMVISNMNYYTKVYVLETTNIFLEALTYKFIGGKLVKPPFKFENLTKFKIVFKPPTICTLYDIAEFLKECPKIKHVVIDLQNFTFEHRLHFWEMHHKEEIRNNNYLFMFLTEVKIIGYKGHWHELDIVEFFVKNAPSLVKLELEMPKNTKSKAPAPDYARINSIRSKFPAIKVTEV